MFTNELVIVCCRIAERFLKDIQKDVKKSGSYWESPVRQVTTTKDYRMDAVTLGTINANTNVSMAAMDAFCHYVNFEQIRMCAYHKNNSSDEIKACIAAVVMRPSLAFTEHRSEYDFVVRGNVDYLMHLITDMRGNLLTSQFTPPFDTIWPIAMLKPAG